ncbi:(2Fe-2S)-binding protein [Natribacillus halophilus]|uniref:BFD-like [2Fe-2S] binding domain-containing protein n=1 Tax=Natribacillus halophilus TaxID=549003 RepID=A0A1G8P3H0_9BACI|nr:(2Fe-2S)-binding protein [Natribacillus halophilus]SDI86987.1 BFD-like [2Fe-2S] binding domain-containing protein [Natribacillus halophilus]
MKGSTIVCRCEEITAYEIQTAIHMGAETFDDVKRITRCGMGYCQGKICMNPVRRLIAQEKNVSLHDIPLPRMRMPLRMMRMDVLATSSSASTIQSILKEATAKVGEEDDQ